MATGAEFFRPTRRGALARLAQRLEENYGPGRALPGGRRKIVERAARKLAISQGDLEALDFAEKKAALELLWRRSGVFVADGDFVARWLDWAGRDWRPLIADTRILIALLRHYDPEAPAQAAVQQFLAPRAQNIWGRFGDFARAHRLWTAEAPQRIAEQLSQDDGFLREAAASAQARPILAASGFLVDLLAQFARQPAFGRHILPRLLDFFEPSGLLSALGPASARQAAKIAFAARLIDEALALPQDWPEVFALLRRVLSDPRENLEDWRNVPAERLAALEAWLAPQTLDLSFELAAALQSDDPRIIAQRRNFWSGYAGHLTRARLIGAAKTQKLARARGAPCRPLKTYLSDHCGFIAQFAGADGRGFVVVELNNRAQSLFWPQEAREAPDFDQKLLDGAQLRAKAAQAQSHLPPESWPEKFAALIFEIAAVPPV